MIKTVPLKKNYEFMKVYKKGKYYAGRLVVLYVLPNNQNVDRLGITVSKKFGKSVKRNRIRRLIRESYRLYEEYVLDGFDCVFVARSAGVMPDFSDIRKEIKYLMRKLNVFDQEKWECLKSP